MVTGFQIEDYALVARAPTISRWIVDLADGMVGMTRTDIFPVTAARPQIRQSVESDWYSKIDRNLTHGVAEIFKCISRITACIANNNELTASTHHLVDTKVLEMATVGEINVLLIFSGHAHQLGKQ